MAVTPQRAAAASGMFEPDAPRSASVLKFSAETAMLSFSASLPLPSNPTAVSSLIIRPPRSGMRPGAAFGNRRLIVAMGRVGTLA